MPDPVIKDPIIRGKEGQPVEPEIPVPTPVEPPVEEPTEESEEEKNKD